MMRPYEAVMHSALVLILLAACDGGMPPPVKFGQSGEGYATKIDFARLEHELPLSPADLMKITPANLEAATQEQVDQIYARLTAGPIPDGPYEGQAFFPAGSTGRARLAEVVGGGLKGMVVDLKTAKLEHIAEAVDLEQGEAHRPAQLAAALHGRGNAREEAGIGCYRGGSGGRF